MAWSAPRAFLADPLSRNVDSLINLEARGVSGPANMFETSRPNGAAIAAVSAEPRAHPVANSLSTDVYRLMPNYTDVNSFAERGWLTLNIAPIGNETRYHSRRRQRRGARPPRRSSIWATRRWRWPQSAGRERPAAAAPASASSWTSPGGR